MPSTAAKAINRSAKLGDSIHFDAADIKKRFLKKPEEETIPTKTMTSVRDWRGNPAGK